MGNELRFILLGLGLLLIAGLWWWEQRRPSRPSDASLARAPERFDVPLEAEGSWNGSSREGRREPVLEQESVRVPPMRWSEERPVPSNDPPILTIDDLPEDTDHVFLSADRADARPGRSVDRDPPAVEHADPDLQVISAQGLFDALPESETQSQDEAAESAPTWQLEESEKPLSDDAVSPDEWRSEDEVDEQSTEPLQETVETAPLQASAPKQRIVAIRLITPPERLIGGLELRLAFDEEGLEFGRYSIFHRLQGAKPVFSVASLIEPGTFDPNNLGEIQVPGISFFAIFPGPMSAPEAFDDLLSTARRLADRWDAVLQDEHGVSLTGPRVLSLREELVRFEHMLSLTRPRSGA